MTNTRKPRSDKGKPRMAKDEASRAAHKDIATDVPAAEPEVAHDVADEQVSGESLPELGRVNHEGCRKADSLGSLELTAISQEAWEAYDMQDVRVRYDTKGFRWWFGVITDTGNSELKLERASVVGDLHCMFISTADLGRDCARQLVDDAVRGMA